MIWLRQKRPVVRAHSGAKRHYRTARFTKLKIACLAQKLPIRRRQTNPAGIAFSALAQKLPDKVRTSDATSIQHQCQPGSLAGSLIRSGQLEGVAAAGGGYLQVQRCVLGMGAIVEQGLGSLAGGADLDQLGITRMLFAEMGTESALAVVEL
jgi:hypothetical protein